MDKLDQKAEYHDFIANHSMITACHIICSMLENKMIDKNDIKSEFRKILFSFHDVAEDIFFPTPIVPVNQSVGNDYLICLEDGKKVKSLQTYLLKEFNMTPEEYKRRWRLPHDYPMIHEKFTSIRRKIAKRTNKQRHIKDA